MRPVPIFFCRHPRGARGPHVKCAFQDMEEKPVNFAVGTLGGDPRPVVPRDFSPGAAGV